jgi:hypothetical protein
MVKVGACFSVVNLFWFSACATPVLVYSAFLVSFKLSGVHLTQPSARLSSMAAQWTAQHGWSAAAIMQLFQFGAPA